jgi:hypothetical protein
VNRRAARGLVPIRLLIASACLLIGVTVGSVGSALDVGTAEASAFEAAAATVPDPSPDTPTVTANEFLPEDRDLTDCVGVLEKPGCGSKERGGVMLNVVFLLVMGGMAFIFWRIIVGVRKNRAGMMEP